MTRVKLCADPMPNARIVASAKINAHFSRLAEDTAAIDRVHARKRKIAVAVKAGHNAPETFMAEAKLRGLSADAFADLILNKPRVTAEGDARELERQRLLLEIEAAKSPASIDTILGLMAAHGAPQAR